MAIDAWANAYNVMRAKVNNAQCEVANLREQLACKTSELAGLREGLDTIEQHRPKVMMPQPGDA